MSAPGFLIDYRPESDTDKDATRFTEMPYFVYIRYFPDGHSWCSSYGAHMHEWIDWMEKDHCPHIDTAEAMVLGWDVCRDCGHDIRSGR